MICKNCGVKLKENQKYCIRCGSVTEFDNFESSIMTLEQLETLRKKIAKKQTIGYAIVIILLFLNIFILKNRGIIASILIIGIVVVNLVTIKDKKEFKKMYKSTVVLQTLKTIFSNVCYQPERGLRKEVLKDTAMINMGNRYYSNDYISAKYKNIPFISSDVLIQDEYTDSDGDTHVVTLFQGQWFIFDFNKTFKADIQICEKDFRNSKRGNLFGKDKFKKVELEDIEFNKRFNVYAQNELDAFYVLTPATMQKIKEVEDRVSGSLLFCFIDNKLHVGLYNNKDLFEYKNIYKPVNLETEKNNILTDMKNITEFVDVLDLDNDLFRREN